MAKKRVFTKIAQNVKANNNTVLNLSRGDDLSAVSYVMKMEITHNNTNALTMTDFDFLSNVVSNINLELGAGTKVIDLPIRDLLLIQLTTRGYLDLTIDKASGNSKKSIVTLILDMALWNFINPKDTLLHTWKYNHRVINIEGATFEKHADVTITDVKVKVDEHFKKGVTPNIVSDGKTQKELNLIKKPIAKNKPIVGTETMEIEFPTRKKVLGIILFAVDTNGVIVDGCITSCKIVNASENIIGTRTLEDINQLNRASRILQSPTSSYFNNVCFIDIAQGQISEAIDTAVMDEEDTVLSVDVTKNGHSNPNVRAIFLTVDKA